MKLINTIIAITFSFLIVNTVIAVPHQKLALMSLENLPAVDGKTGKRNWPKKKKKKKYRGGSCLRSVDTVRRKARAIDDIIIKSSRRYSVDSNLIRAVIAVESCYNRYAVSPAGAQGFMQLIPATAERFGVSDSFNARQNINAGTKYLSFLLKRFNGDLRKATAGYNAGEGAVDRYKGIPPYRETRNYVKNVLRIFGDLSGNPNLASLVMDDGLVNRSPATYKGMSAEKRAILSRIQSFGVKSAYPKKRALLHKKQLTKKPTRSHVKKAKPVYKGGLKFNRDQVKNSDISHLSPRKQKAIKRLQLLQKKLRLLSAKRAKPTSRRMIAKPGREGWKSNRQGAARLYKKR